MCARPFAPPPSRATPIFGRLAVCWAKHSAAKRKQSVRTHVSLIALAGDRSCPFNAFVALRTFFRVAAHPARRTGAIGLRRRERLRDAFDLRRRVWLSFVTNFSQELTAFGDMIFGLYALGRRTVDNAEDSAPLFRLGDDHFHRICGRAEDGADLGDI